ncbi:MAG: hypothetical protein ACRDO9_04750, partial [Gaiellales bacterium]
PTYRSSSTEAPTRLVLMKQLDIDAELGGEELVSCGCDCDRAVAIALLDPSELEQARGGRGADRPGEMKVALAPVEADPHERASSPRQRLDVDPVGFANSAAVLRWPAR